MAPSSEQKTRGGALFFSTIAKAHLWQNLLQVAYSNVLKIISARWIMPLQRDGASVEIQQTSLVCGRTLRVFRLGVINHLVAVDENSDVLSFHAYSHLEPFCFIHRGLHQINDVVEAASFSGIAPLVVQL